jgi:hypothetical protein
MSSKDLKRTPHATALTRMPATDADYERRYGQLKRDAARSLPKPLTIESFLVRLIDAKRPTWSASSWRQNRAAAVYGFELERTANPDRSASIDAAIARLKGTPPAKRTNLAPRTSQQKAKRLLPDDLDRIIHRALAGRAPNAQALADMLNSSNITGLRPREWPTAEFRRSQVPGFAFELIVRNGKRDAVRAHGEFRTLRWAELNTETVATITNWIAQAREAESAGTYRTLLATLQALMRDLTKNLFPRRQKRPTLYTPRHEAAARWKAAYVYSAVTDEERIQGLAMVAALLGHASDATATAHYGRPHQGERGSSRFPVPVPDAAEVARVRRRMQMKLERLAASRRRPDGHQPRGGPR